MIVRKRREEEEKESKHDEIKFNRVNETKSYVIIFFE